MLLSVLLSIENRCEGGEQISTWPGFWRILPTPLDTLSLETGTSLAAGYRSDVGEERGKFKVRRRFKKFLLPLLLAYKLKFFTLIPVMIGGLVLLTGATGLAGFFFALFAAVMGLKSGH
ncbi:Protein of unknown function (DUF1676) [Popillia japonica]|uniref:Uncharacterized protein n=1 Tax=Popillia japonica TaxID=7064 RepID=A0AAW1IST0_POPJA